MNSLTADWSIKERSESCNATQRPFAAGEYFYTLLYRDGDGFRREDLSEEAWEGRNENIQPFSFWKTRYEPAPPASPEPLAKENAEELFRRLMTKPDTSTALLFVLAAMLERKKVLKQVGTDESEGRRKLIYEHTGNGDVFVVPDPQLRLDDLSRVQAEVTQLLNAAF